MAMLERMKRKLKRRTWRTRSKIKTFRNVFHSEKMLYVSFHSFTQFWTCIALASYYAVHSYFSELYCMKSHCIVQKEKFIHNIQYYWNVWQHFNSQKIKIIFSQYSNTYITQKLYMFQQTYSVHMRQTDWVQFHFIQDINDILSFQRQSSAWNSYRNIRLLHSSVHTSMYIIYVYGTENQENLDCVDLFSWINKNWKKLCAVNT